MKLKEKMKNNKHKKFDKKKLIGTISKKHIKLYQEVSVLR